MKSHPNKVRFLAGICLIAIEGISVENNDAAGTIIESILLISGLVLIFSAVIDSFRNRRKKA